MVRALSTARVVTTAWVCSSVTRLFSAARVASSLFGARAIAGPSAGDGDAWAGQSSTIRLKPGDDLDAVHRVYLDTEKVEEVE
jgi:hypothetical protein